MTDPTLLAIDQGTTSSRAIMFSSAGTVLHTAQKELTQHFPQPGWVEHDANEIWQDTLDTARQVVQENGGADTIAAIGITNQRETIVLWDTDSGMPLYNAIVWQDRRTAPFCKSLREQGLESSISEKTGLLIDPYFSCSKIRWLFDNVAAVTECAAAGRLACGTIDCFLLWKLTAGRVHATDATNAARTGLFNIQTQQWDMGLLEVYGIPAAILPEVKDNVAEFGMTDPALFGRSIPIGGMAGDQHAALIGQCCFAPGMIKSTYGTGCFALMNIGTAFQQSQNRLLTTPAYRLNGETTYAVEGSIFMAGAVVQWLRDELQIISHAAETEALALSAEGNNGVYLIPAFTGLGAPHWQPEARAAIMGLTRGANKAHIVRAALEAQAYQTMDLLGAMTADSGVSPAQIRVDGGLVANQFVCQFLADILRVSIDVPRVNETTALGAACLAGLYAGVYNGLDDLSKIWQEDRSYHPQMAAAASTELYGQWREYLERVR